MHGLLTKICDILDSVVSKLVGKMKMASNLVYLFNSTSMQHQEVCSLQFPSLHNITNTVPHSEACLYSHIIWLLAQ